VNTPLGAIQAASSNAINALESALPKLPELFIRLSSEQQQLMFLLIEQSLQGTAFLTAREKRQRRRSLAQQMEGYGIEAARAIADTLIDMGIEGKLSRFYPFCKVKIICLLLIWPTIWLASKGIVKPFNWRLNGLRAW
jgi:two-component system NtrC family sensor kinase